MGDIPKSGGSEVQGSVYVCPSWEMPGSHTEPHRELVTVVVHRVSLNTSVSVHPQIALEALVQTVH